MKFQVFKEGKLAKDFSLSGAYVFGSDGIAIRRVKIGFKNGIIECKKPHQSTSGLSLLWSVDGFGKLILPTTCLPERDMPYILNIEIARARLMQIVTKCEDWAYFDEVKGLTHILRDAQELFIQAIENISSPAIASKKADSSLRKAMIFSEKLAIQRAESLFNAKNISHGFSRGCLGCRIDPDQINNSRYVEKFMELFGFVILPIRWAELERKKEVYDFSGIDACIHVLSKKKLAICAGPLIRFSPDYLPDWLMTGKSDFEKIRESAYQFVAKMVARYADRIRSWSVIGGLNLHNYFGFNFEEILEMTRAVMMAVKAVSNRVLKIIEISNCWGEYYATVPNTIPPLVYIDMILQSGISFDAFGLQMQFGKNESGMQVRDMMEISANLDRFAAASRAIYITGVEVPSEPSTSKDRALAGQWHGQWNQTLQAQWLEQFYKIALSKPFIDSIIYSNLTDADKCDIEHSGLLTKELENKESFLRLRKLYKIIFTR